MPGTHFSRLSSFSGSPALRLPLFLTPAFSNPTWQTSTSAQRTFTSTPSAQISRKRSREKNKQRGVSAIRHTGPRVPLSIAKYPLPKPVRDSKKRDEFPVDPNHGLWGFFHETKAPMISPEEEDAHGRPWTYQEIDYKSFTDLHRLYWACLKERNRIATRYKERHRLQAGYGNYESDTRDAVVRKTMWTIRKVLLSRYNLREDARALVEKNNIVTVLEEHETDLQKIVEEKLAKDEQAFEATETLR